MNRQWVALTVATIASVAGCMQGVVDSGIPGVAGDACSETADCEDGLQCIDGRCRQPCIDVSLCSEGTFCIDGMCLPKPVACGDGYVDRDETCDDGDPLDDNACHNDCTAAACGDGIRRGDIVNRTNPAYEECDDGNAADTDACRNDCRLAFCGDGIRRDITVVSDPAFEACDDGNRVDTDDCSNACRTAFCGDGIVRDDVPSEDPAYEECDDGNTADDDACLQTCVRARCGDGFVGPGEGCDPAAPAPPVCTARCALTTCGNATLDPGEQCDVEVLDDNGDCLTTCVPAACGDGFVHAGVEACDDGNWRTDDGCPDGSAGPCAPARCGDSFVFAGVEGCDDGNGATGDACPDGSGGTCLLARCGDGFVHGGIEECDDGNAVDTDACPDGTFGRCLEAACGDGIVRQDVTAPTEPDFEACDDANDVDEDACVSGCRANACGDGYLGPGEGCDDGNLDGADACSATCAPASCGDGVVQQGEQCDDGNPNNNDACLDSCRHALCGDGSIRAGVELCDDGNGSNGDACPDGPGGSCRPGACGDGFVRVGVETCDDGNSDVEDACPDGLSGNCQPARCGDGFVWDSVEDCDDGNGVLTDACPDGAVAFCLDAACGDGFLRDQGETCDDGNNVSADGCAADCDFVVWETSTGGAVVGGISGAAAGTMAVVVTATEDGLVRAYDRVAGTETFTYNAGAGVLQAPALWVEGTALHIGVRDVTGALHGVKRTAAGVLTSWSHALAGPGGGGVAISGAGRSYVALDGNGTMVRYDFEGLNQGWAGTQSSPITGAPCGSCTPVLAYGSGTVNGVVVAIGSRVYGWNLFGDCGPGWFDLGPDPAVGTVAFLGDQDGGLGAGDYAFVATETGSVVGGELNTGAGWDCAANMFANLLWYPAGGGPRIVGAPAVHRPADVNQIFYGDVVGVLHRFDWRAGITPTADVWSFTADAPLRGTPLLVRTDGVLTTVVTGDDLGTLYAVSAVDGSLRWRIDLDAPLAGSALAWAGLIYAVSEAGTLYALERGGETAPPARSWARQGGNMGSAGYSSGCGATSPAAWWVLLALLGLARRSSAPG